MADRSLPRSLSELKEGYDRDGYICPVPVLSGEETAAIRGRVESYLGRTSRDARDTKNDPLLQFKVHMVFPWADKLIHHSGALDAVEALIGPDILVWNTAVLIKGPHTRDFVSWHQDVYYWGNHPDHVVGAWIALAESTPENGCVRVIPGSHAWGILPHKDTFGEDNILSRGQQIDSSRIDERLAKDMVLQPGEMSLHHTCTVHGSRPNRSGRPRIGFVITYMCPATVMRGPRTGATLVRGSDTRGHFDLETVRPAIDLDPAGLAAHDEAMRPFSEAIYEGAQKDGRRAPGHISNRGS
ncbi:MAG TPA: phytanoyl-CoA dioxygenase family protein [Alphaproteobacteria bacterium]|nr:phytanoyl-CoA dioxygenase family protein [Alphaproteobacteria bacterium]